MSITQVSSWETLAVWEGRFADGLTEAIELVPAGLRVPGERPAARAELGGRDHRHPDEVASRRLPPHRPRRVPARHRSGVRRRRRLERARGRPRPLLGTQYLQGGDCPVVVASVWLFSKQTEHVGLAPSHVPSVGDITFEAGQVVTAMVYLAWHALAGDMRRRAPARAKGPGSGAR
jgi:hypothetical protein